MNIDFSTCEAWRALGYIQKVYPDVKVTSDKVEKLLSLVTADIVRIQDPLMYGSKIGVMPGRNFKEEHRESVIEAVQQLKDNLK